MHKCPQNIMDYSQPKVKTFVCTKAIMHQLTHGSWLYNHFWFLYGLNKDVIFSSMRVKLFVGICTRFIIKLQKVLKTDWIGSDQTKDPRSSPPWACSQTAIRTSRRVQEQNKHIAALPSYTIPFFSHLISGVMCLYQCRFIRSLTLQILTRMIFMQIFFFYLLIF